MTSINDIENRRDDLFHRVLLIVVIIAMIAAMSALGPTIKNVVGL